MYTLKASAPGLTSATSDPFDALLGTGPQSDALWNGTNYTVRAWMIQNEQRVALNTGDTCTVTIYKPDAASEATPTMTLSDEDLVPVWAKLAPMNRIGNPEELQGVALYLASDASTYTTGTDVVVDGGYTCW